jgi:hypothetical protein
MTRKTLTLADLIPNRNLSEAIAGAASNEPCGRIERIEGLLQSLLGKVDGLGEELTRQGSSSFSSSSSSSSSLAAPAQEKSKSPEQAMEGLEEKMMARTREDADAAQEKEDSSAAVPGLTQSAAAAAVPAAIYLLPTRRDDGSWDCLLCSYTNPPEFDTTCGCCMQKSGFPKARPSRRYARAYKM